VQEQRSSLNGTAITQVDPKKDSSMIVERGINTDRIVVRVRYGGYPLFFFVGKAVWLRGLFLFMDIWLWVYTIINFDYNMDESFFYVL